MRYASWVYVAQSKHITWVEVIDFQIIYAFVFVFVFVLFGVDAAADATAAVNFMYVATAFLYRCAKTNASQNVIIWKRLRFIEWKTKTKDAQIHVRRHTYCMNILNRFYKNVNVQKIRLLFDFFPFHRLWHRYRSKYIEDII